MTIDRSDSPFIERSREESHPLIADDENLIDTLLVGADSDWRPTLSVVLPTRNEEDSIKQCIGKIKTTIIELGVTAEIIISDSSTDRTPDIASEQGAIVVEPDVLGYGNAYQFAFEYVRGDFVVMGDADMSYDFETIPRLLDTLISEEADLVIGSRLSGEIKSGSMPWLHRYLGNPLLTRFLNTVHDADVSDSQSGFRVVRKEALSSMDLQSDGMEFASEMVLEAVAHDLDIAECPITYHPREGEATLRSFRDGWRHMTLILLNAPGFLISIFGAMLVMLGMLMIVTVSVSVDRWIPSVYLIFGGSIVIIIGFSLRRFGLSKELTGNRSRQ